MKKQIIFPFTFFLAGLLLVGCGAVAPSQLPTATPDVAATVEAAVQATAVAQAQLQQQIDTAVDAALTEAQIDQTVDAAVDTAVAEAIDPAVEAAVDAAFAEYATQSEAELAAAIDTAVDEAVTATESYATATTSASSDGTVTTDEVQTIEVYVSGAEAAVEEAEVLIEAYYELYGDLAQQAVGELSAIESELDDIDNSIDSMNATLDEINQTLEAGLELADETIAELQTTADTATAAAQAAQVQAQAWSQNVQSEVENRAAHLQTLSPTSIAANPQEALQQVTQYVDTVNAATLDNMISQGELSQIAQLGANATAGLEAQGIPQLAQLSGAINQVTQQLSRGDLSQAGLELGNLQAGFSGLPDLSQLGNLPGAGGIEAGAVGDKLGNGASLPEINRPEGGGANLGGGGGPRRP